MAFAVCLGFVVSGCMRAPIYHPTSVSPAQVEQLAAAYGARVERLAVSSRVELVGVRRDPVGAAPLLLFFGGNAMAISESVAVLREVATDDDWGFAVWAYRGYDGSGGSPAQKALFADALAQVNHLGIPAERLAVIGQSLGTGVAVHLAAERARAGQAPAAVVLLSPYTSIRRVADELLGMPIGWILSDRFETLDELPGVQSPVLVIHGARDDVIPAAHGREVAAALGERATLVEVEVAGHNDLWAMPQTAATIRRFIAAQTGWAPAEGP